MAPDETLLNLSTARNCTNNLCNNGRLNEVIKLSSAAVQVIKQVSILLNNNITCQILNTYQDPLGRFLICNIRTNGIYVTIANLFAPNDDNKSFSQIFFDHLRDFQGEDIIIGRDFNLVLDVRKRG